MSFLWLLLLLIIAAILFLAAFASKSRGGDSKAPWPYVAKPILTEREQVLYHRLTEAFPDLLIFSQVQISQIVKIKPRTQNRRLWLNKVIQKSADFVVCRRDTSVICVIELDDGSHDNATQARRDAVKTRALRDAGIPLYRYRQVPGITALCEALGRKLPDMPEVADRHGIIVKEFGPVQEHPARNASTG